MEYEVYADVVFLINFIMNIMIFLIAGKLANFKTPMLRLIAGAGVSAGLYCMLVFIPFFLPYYNFFTTFAILLIGLIIAYKTSSVATTLKLALLSNIAAFSLGGIVIALFYYTKIGTSISKSLDFSIDNISLKVLITASAIAYITIKILSKRIYNQTVRKQAFYTLNIFFGDKMVSATALLDTGNSLCDPITNEPVTVVEFQSVKIFLPEEAVKIYESSREDELFELMTVFSKTEFVRKVRILPFTSLGKQNGMLIGFKPDYMKILNSESEDLIIKETVIAISNASLSADGSYNALLNPSLL